jgi:hypothetical protein
VTRKLLPQRLGGRHDHEFGGRSICPVCQLRGRTWRSEGSTVTLLHCVTGALERAR